MFVTLKYLNFSQLRKYRMNWTHYFILLTNQGKNKVKAMELSVLCSSA